VDVCKSMILEKLEKATKDTFASDILNAKVPLLFFITLEPRVE